MADESTRRDNPDEDRYYKEQVLKAADPDATLESSLDLDGLVANMAELAAIAPSWRDHVPHDVAVQFNANEQYQRQYGAHVDSCALCQQLIETLAPRDEVLEKVLETVEATPLHEALEELVRRLFGPGRHPIPVPTAAFAERFAAPMSIRILEVLREAEHSQNPLEQFGAVEAYLRYHRPELAYGLLARGLERCGLDRRIAIRIRNAPRLETQGADHLLDLVHERQAAASADPIRSVEVLVQLGDHAAALRELGKVVEDRGLWREPTVTSESG